VEFGGAEMGFLEVTQVGLGGLREWFGWCDLVGAYWGGFGKGIASFMDLRCIMWCLWLAVVVVN
jgi:hypothetical protein